VIIFENLHATSLRVHVAAGRWRHTARWCPWV